jgi:MFS family permease
MQMVTAAVAFAILTRVPETYSPDAHRARRQWLPRSLITPGIAIGCVNVHYPVVAGFLILHLARHGHSGPVAFSAYAGLILVSRFFLGGLPDRMHPRITFYFGISAMTAGLAVLAAGPPPVPAVAAAALLGFGFSFPWSSIASAVLKQTPVGEHGTAVGVLSAFYDLFVGVSSLAAGVISAHFGYPAAFLMAAASLVVAAVVGIFVFPQRQTESFPVEDQYLDPVEP